MGLEIKKSLTKREKDRLIEKEKEKERNLEKEMERERIKSERAKEPASSSKKRGRPVSVLKETAAAAAEDEEAEDKGEGHGEEVEREGEGETNELESHKKKKKKKDVAVSLSWLESAHKEWHRVNQSASHDLLESLLATGKGGSNKKSTASYLDEALSLASAAEASVVKGPKDLLEWRETTTEKELYRLERIIQCTLTALGLQQIRADGTITITATNTTTVKATATETATARSHQRKEYLSRTITEDFEDAPVELIPDYHTFVRRVVSLTTIRKRLNLHGYNSLGAVSLDFYTMLNNARAVTLENSQVRNRGAACLFLSFFFFLSLCLSLSVSI